MRTPERTPTARLPVPHPAPRVRRAGRAAREAAVPTRAGLIVRWSHLRRDGAWALPRHLRAAAFMGGLELDLRRARIAPGVSLVELLSIAGIVTVRVPAGVRVDCDGDRVIGGADALARAMRHVPPDAPVVRITGTRFLGGIRVLVEPTETP